MDSNKTISILQGNDVDDKASGVIQKRLNKVLETHIESDKDMLEALKELSIFFKDNTLISRRNLRSQIEKRSLSINEDFLSAFRKVKETLDTMYDDVLEMNNAVNTMSTQLHNTKAQTHQLIQQTNKLQTDSDKITMKQKITEAFIREYQLSESEITVLRSHDVSIAFFNILDRVEMINSKCKILMQSGHETCALDIQQQMNMYKESALDKIYRWCQVHCKDIESPEISILLYKSMSKLQEHSILFKYIINEYCTCRRAIVVRLFIDALTSGVNAIESYAYDVKRYTSDMLAWLHQIIPIEKQYLHTLLKLCSNVEKETTINDALANISDGVCNPLRVRIEKILTSNTIPISLYTVTTLLRFYMKLISNVITSNNNLERTLVELVETSENIFINTLQKLVKHKILEKIEAPNNDLVPSPGVTHLLNLLKEILTVANISEDVNDIKNDTAKIVNNIIDPLLQTINLSASRLSTVDMSVYLLNCLHIINNTLNNYKYIENYIERINAQCDMQLDTLTSEQSSWFVINLNLAPIYTILQEISNKNNSKLIEPLSKINGMEIDNLNIFLNNFETFLYNYYNLIMPQINCIINNEHRNTILNRSCQVICAIYKQLYDAVHDPTNLYDNPSSIMTKTPDEIKVILNENRQKVVNTLPNNTTSVVQDI